ncbi:MAG: CDGSH iron-sulfur domain-containing protein [Candidatus Dadabacteria bacterium]|nr:MAG: CDGSH iron-sulfur domain-containing protein [Candidatus Dadabacteria bacterium]
MSDKPEVPQKGPYILEMEPGKYYWCACGRSNNQPFCDGSHQGTEFTPVEFEVTVKKKVGWCGCKHSKRGPICDGTHNNLLQDN